MDAHLGLLLIFWYGILHAFGPDHLTAIADFSIGREQKKTMAITAAFAVGHGISLFVFAKILQHVAIPESVLAWGDTLSSLVIAAIGVYLLALVAFNRIHVGIHRHEDGEHVHIWFGRKHRHDEAPASRTLSAFTVGALMGIGGVRGMLVTLSAVAHDEVNAMMVLAFTVGVMIVFVGFGVIVSTINRTLLTSRRNVRALFGSAGSASLAIGIAMLTGAL